MQKWCKASIPNLKSYYKKTLNTVCWRKYIRKYYTLRTLIGLVFLSSCIAIWLLSQLHTPETNKPTASNLIENSNQSHWLVNTEVEYYRLSPDKSYHYEFRYQFSTNNSLHRLMFLLGGHRRQCIDWWTFSVGRRILSSIRSSNFSILSVCSPRSTFDPKFPIEENQDVQWIYKSLQKWMNDVYYAKYQQYPLLYLYGVSRGSHFAGLLCRVLPIQAQILYLYPGYFEGMTLRSALDRDIQTRLTLDSAFAAWFHFKFCYTKISKLCVFQNKNKIVNWNPLPPTYFVHALNDGKLNKSDYTNIISAIEKDAYELGGLLLSDRDSLKLHVSFPPNATPSYMQEHFYPWRHKPHASALLYEHLIGFPRLPEQQNGESMFRTFWCHHGDFIFFERFPSIMRTWSEKAQEEYREYSNDIHTFHELITEEFCGDLSAQHAMISLDLDRALLWLNQIDSLRQRLKIEDFLSRPLRIWMYKKDKLVPDRYKNHHIVANCSQNVYANRMYSTEHIIQDYFHQPTYASNPFVADYFIIPHDMYCFIFFHQLFANFTNEQFKAHVSHYSQHYFELIVDKVRYALPFWTMTNQPGSNHIIAFVGGRNMGVLDDHLQKVLKNVIQLGPTGVRQDLLSKKAPELYLHRNLSIVYRHGYDIVIPPFTPTEAMKINISSDWYQLKKELFYFAGTLNHSVLLKSVRQSLSDFARNLSTIITIAGKEFSPITIIDRQVSMPEYVESIISSVFLLCPEGYSPWTPRIYEAINLGSIPLILADGIVLPFERFIPWRSFSLKINISNVNDILAFAIDNNTWDFENRTKNKIMNAQRYKTAFRWLFEDSYGRTKQHDILALDKHVNKNVFHYIYRELRCRRLEQFFGASPDTLSSPSVKAREDVCSSYGDTCPCINEQPIAFDQYSYKEEHSQNKSTISPVKILSTRAAIDIIANHSTPINDTKILLNELLKKLDKLLNAETTRENHG